MAENDAPKTTNLSDDDLLILAELGTDEDLATLSQTQVSRAIYLLEQAVDRDKSAETIQAATIQQVKIDGIRDPLAATKANTVEPEQAKGTFNEEDFFDPASPSAGSFEPPAPPGGLEIGDPSTSDVLSAAGAAIEQSSADFRDSAIRSVLEPGSFLPNVRGDAGDKSLMRSFNEETGELEPERSMGETIKNLTDAVAPFRLVPRTDRHSSKLPTEGFDENGNELVRVPGSLYSATAHLVEMQFGGGVDTPTFRTSQEILEIAQAFGYFLDWDMMDPESTGGIGSLGFWKQDPRQGPWVNPEWNRGHAYALDMLNEQWVEQTDVWENIKKAGGVGWSILKGAGSAVKFLGKAALPDLQRDEASGDTKLVRSEEHQKFASGVGFVSEMALMIVSQLGENLAEMNENPQRFAEEKTTEAMDLVGMLAGGTGLALRAVRVVPKGMKGMRAVMMLQGYAQAGPDGMAGAVVVSEAADYLKIARREAARLKNTSAEATGLTRAVREAQDVLEESIDSGAADELLTRAREVIQSGEGIPAERVVAKALVGEAADSSPELLDLADEQLDQVSRGYLDGLEFLNNVENRTPEMDELAGDLRDGYRRRQVLKEAAAAERAPIEDTTLAVEEVVLKAAAIPDAPDRVKQLEGPVQEILEHLAVSSKGSDDAMAMLRRLIALSKTETGTKAIGLATAATLLPHALFGKDATNTEKLATLGPFFLLAAIPILPSSMARKAALRRAGQMISFRTAAIVRRLGDVTDDSIIAERLRADTDLAGVVKMYENLAPKDSLLSTVIPEARRIMQEVTEELVTPTPGKASGTTRKSVLAGMASTSIGAAIGAKALSGYENGDGGDFGPTGLILGAAIGFGFSRYLRDPSVRNAIADVMSIPDSDFRKFFMRAPGKQGTPSFEAVFTSIIEPLLPTSIPVLPGRVATGAAAGAAGAAAGAVVTTFPEEQDPNPLLTMLGAGAGMALGAAGSKRVMRTIFNLDFNPRKSFRAFIRLDKGLPGEYAALKEVVRTRIMGRVQEIRDVAIKLDKLGPDVGEAIDDFRRGNRSLESLPSDEAQMLALQLGQIFDGLALDIVEVGIATGEVKETILSNVGTYLPRLYYAYEMEDANRAFEGLVEWAYSQGVPISKLSDMDYMKKRSDLPEWLREALGEITDNPAYLLAKRGIPTSADVENRRLMNWIASSDNVLPAGVIKRRVKDFEVEEYLRKLELDRGEMVELDPTTGTTGAKPIRRPQSIEEYREIRSRIRQAELAGNEEAREFSVGRYQYAEWNGERYLKFEDSPKWGPLRGKYVKEDIAMDQIAKRDIPESIARVLIDSGTGLFKTGKVLWNPATLARNLWSNGILADFAGVSPIDVKHYWATRKDFKFAGQDYLDARRAGLFGGEFRSAEIDQLLAGVDESSAWGAAATSAINNNLVKIIRNVGVKVGAKKISFETLERFHEGSEQFFKLLVFKKARQKGKSVEEAVALAKRYIFDYDAVPEWIRLTRRSVFGAPFITFSYKSLPRMIEHAVAVGDPKKALKFYKWVAMMGAVNEVAARTLAPEALGRTEPVDPGPIATIKRVASAGLGFGDPIGYKRWLPDWGGSQQVLLPGVDQWGRARSYDASWTSPWGDFGEFGQGVLGRNLASAGIAWPRFAEPGNPWLHAMTGFMTGKDPFSGEDIRSVGAGTGESIVDIMRWQMRLWGPQLINPAGRSAEKLWRAGTSNLEADPFVPGFWTGLASEAFGLKNRTFDPSRSWSFRAATLRNNLGDMEAEMRRLQRRGAPDASIKRKKRDILRARDVFFNSFGKKAPAANEALESAISAANKRRIEKSQAGGDSAFMRLLGLTGDKE